jgi:hypothetical protein
MFSEKENHGTQDTKLRLVNNNAVDITSVIQSMAMISSGPLLPLTNIINNKLTGQSQSSVKHTKGLAVVSTGLMDKYIRSQ